MDTPPVHLLAHLLLLLLLLPVLTSAGVRGGEGLIPPPPLVTDQPYFDSSMPTNLTAHVGRKAELHCRVHSIGNRTVSWIRGRDLRILTVGRYTYTTDLRYEALHKAGTNQWTLRIKSAQLRDSGTYECQISTKPIMAFSTYLRVLEPRGEILGAPDLYVQKGSMINLTCILHHLPEPPAYVRWYHKNKNISYSSSRGGVSMIVEKGPTTISYLLLTSARVEDSGTYTCSSTALNSTSIQVHVLDGEEPAAMQKNNTSPHSRHLPAKVEQPASVNNNNKSSVVSSLLPSLTINNTSSTNTHIPATSTTNTSNYNNNDNNNNNDSSSSSCSSISTISQVVQELWWRAAVALGVTLVRIPGLVWWVEVT